MTRRSSIYWLVQTLDDIPPGDDWLGGGERALLAGMRISKRRDDWKLGRWTAKGAIFARPNLLPGLDHPSALEIRAAADGAPEAFLQGRPAPLILSISHSRGVSLCSVTAAGIPLGCDLEWVETRDPGFFADYFTEEEKALCRRATDSERALFETLVWSAKESALKALRQGLLRDTRSVVVEFDPARRLPVWNTMSVLCAESLRIFNGWWQIRGGFVMTVAAELPAGETSPPIQLAPPW